MFTNYFFQGNDIMYYKITEKELKAINSMIKILNLAIKRNAFSKEEIDLIFLKLNNINTQSP